MSSDEIEPLFSRSKSPSVQTIPEDEKHTSAGTPWYAAIFIVVNAALGGGLLEFPYAFRQSGGIMAALVIQAVLICFIVGSLFLLAYCSELRGSTTFPGTVKTICGLSTEIISSFCIILYTFGTCVTFLIIISDQLGQFFRGVTNNDNYCDHWYMNKRFTLTLTTVVFVLPLCFSKKIDFLKYASYAGVIAVLYVVFLIIAKYSLADHSKPVHISSRPSSFMDVFKIIPTVCFSYQCHVSIVPIYSCMKDRNLVNFGKTVILAIAICVFAYSVSATLGYYTFGDAVLEDILQSYKPTPDVLVGVIMIAAKTYTTYPILLFCGRIEVEKLYVYARRMNEEIAARSEFVRRCVIAVVWFGATLIVALFVPNIAIVIDVLGGLAALFIFFFPGMCLMKIALDYIPSSTLFKRLSLVVTAGIFMVLGIVLFGVVTAQSIIDDSVPVISLLHCS